MSVLGLIVEYNPLHNGHIYHFNTSLNITQAKNSVCVISGNFVQRGEPSVVDKWARTRMALESGIDLVIEIPVIYCVQSAEFFAYGSISLLQSLGIIDTVCFGSEIGDVKLLNKIANIISTEPYEYKKYLKQELTSGKSFAQSRANALLKYLSKNDTDHLDYNMLNSMLQSSNNILGLEYIKWLIRLNSSIRPVTIKRLSSNYNDTILIDNLSSATAIRKSLKLGQFDLLSSQLPDSSYEILKRQFETDKGPVFFEDFCQSILYILRRMSLREISEIMDVNEGLEHKIKKAAISSCTLEELISDIKSKRYTETRIGRILIHSLLGLTRDQLLRLKEAGGPQYIRVLGFSEKGKELLHRMKKTCTLPIITNTADYKRYDNKYLHEMIELDIRATDIYNTVHKNPHLRKGGMDFYKKPEML
ncbi:hypothetical protein OXPF_21200 [Oxobacter pfennigii]|uniref:tRNA(Met) cytidine acetate ligase n=1 Tax=Oxobacter pfennigii TaxID=36849 RepID=A0A0P9AF19_9CLOT|nr:nucleotidyltransferase [Oxobacter pfennigii]KPU43955.1 hypothetical protein OXPF_21200 [Oxobacter pfennigii]